MACEPISFLSLKSSHSFHWEFVYSVSKIGAYTVPGTVLGPENTRTDKTEPVPRDAAEEMEVFSRHTVWPYAGGY